MKTSQIIHQLIFLTIISFSCSKQFTESGSSVNYLSQTAPGEQPVAFAPDFFAPFENVRDVAFTSDGTEFYFTKIDNDRFTIMYSKFVEQKWTKPRIAGFSGQHNDFEPTISPDGQHFYFASMRPSAQKMEMTNDIDIWQMQRIGNIWSEPQLMDNAINSTCMEYFPSVTENGDLYFGRNDAAMTRGDIHVSRRQSGQYLAPEKLPETVNFPGTSFNAFISADEKFIIFSSYIQTDSVWQSDLFVSFRSESGEWQPAKNLGEKINSPGNDHAPWISFDGRYLFFASTRSDTSGQQKLHRIFWVDAGIIAELE